MSAVPRGTVHPVRRRCVRRCGSAPSRRRPAAPRGGGTGVGQYAGGVPACGQRKHPGTVALHAGARLHRARRRDNAERPPVTRPPGGRRRRDRGPASIPSPALQPASDRHPRPRLPRAGCCATTPNDLDLDAEGVTTECPTTVDAPSSDASNQRYPHRLSRAACSRLTLVQLASRERRSALGVLDRSRPTFDRPADPRAQTRRRFCAPRAVESSPPRPRLRRPSHSSCPGGRDTTPVLV